MLLPELIFIVFDKICPCFCIRFLRLIVPQKGLLILSEFPGHSMMDFKFVDMMMGIWGVEGGY